MSWYKDRSRPVLWSAKLVYMENSKPSLNHQKTPKPQDPPHANTPDQTFHTKVTLCTKIQTGQDRCASSQRNIHEEAKTVLHLHSVILGILPGTCFRKVKLEMLHCSNIEAVPRTLSTSEHLGTLVVPTKLCDSCFHAYTVAYGCRISFQSSKSLRNPISYRF